jgi:peptidoglycan/xylan/chitin deacetylase (PgdA/CDA1 family)
MPRFGTLFGLALAVAIAAAAVLVWILISGAPAGAPTAVVSATDVAVAAGAPTGRAIVVESAATRAYFGGVPGARPEAYDSRLAAWEARLRGAGYEVERRDVGALGSAPPGAPTTLVVPAAAALAEPDVRTILAAAEAGAGVIATWQFGLHRPDGSWSGYDALGRLAGVVPLADADAAEAGVPRFVALRGGGPLAAGLPAGARMEVEPYDAPLPVRGPDAAADWVRWEILPFGAPGHPISPTAVAARRLGRGRVVWLGFDVRAVVRTGDADAWVERLLANALAWVGQRPVVALERWPRAARSASMLGLDVEMDFAAGRAVAAQARAARTPLTAFAVSMLARDDPATVQALAGAGEVASHTHDHQPLAGRGLDAQVRELEESRALLERLVGRPVVGLRPPEERTDAETLVALVRAGYRYVAGLPDKDRAEPSIVGVDGGPLTVVPRVQRDDYEWVVRRPLGDAALVAAAIEADRAYVADLGGVAFFDFHTQYADDPGIAAGVAALLARPLAADEWRATGAEIADWWAQRAAVTAELDPAGPRAAVLRVASVEAIAHIAAEVHAPDAWTALRIDGPGGDADVVAPPVPGGPFRVELSRLRAGETRRVRLVAD